MEPTQEGKEESSPTSPASPSYASPVKVPLPQSPAPEEATSTTATACSPSFAPLQSSSPRQKSPLQCSPTKSPLKSQEDQEQLDDLYDFPPPPSPAGSEDDRDGISFVTAQEDEASPMPQNTAEKEGEEKKRKEDPNVVVIDETDEEEEPNVIVIDDTDDEEEKEEEDIDEDEEFTLGKESKPNVTFADAGETKKHGLFSFTFVPPSSTNHQTPAKATVTTNATAFTPAPTTEQEEQQPIPPHTNAKQGKIRRKSSLFSTPLPATTQSAPPAQPTSHTNGNVGVTVNAPSFSETTSFAQTQIPPAERASSTGAETSSMPLFHVDLSLKTQSVNTVRRKGNKRMTKKNERAKPAPAPVQTNVPHGTDVPGALPVPSISPNNPFNLFCPSAQQVPPPPPPPPPPQGVPTQQVPPPGVPTQQVPPPGVPLQNPVASPSPLTTQVPFGPRLPTSQQQPQQQNLFHADTSTTAADTVTPRNPFFVDTAFSPMNVDMKSPLSFNTNNTGPTPKPTTSTFWKHDASKNENQPTQSSSEEKELSAEEKLAAAAARVAAQAGGEFGGFSIGVAAKDKFTLSSPRKNSGRNGVTGKKKAQQATNGTATFGGAATIPSSEASTPLKQDTAPSTSMAREEETPNKSKMEETEDEKEEEVDYSGRRAHVSALRDEGRSFYISGDYRESVLRYTCAISTYHTHKLYTSSATNCSNSDEDETLAVLYGNRAAALMMTGAFSAAASDCRNALKHAKDVMVLLQPNNKANNSDSLRPECGAPLCSKLLCRLGRALLKAGSVMEANDAFDAAISTAKTALSQSSNSACSAANLDAKHQAEKVLNQSITDATLGKSDIRRSYDAAAGIRQSQHEMNRTASSFNARGNNLQALMHINTALSMSPGDMVLHEKKVNVLASMKRWAELANHVEHLACDCVKLDGIFTEDLELYDPCPGAPAAEYLKADFFDKENGEKNNPQQQQSDQQQKLCPKAVCDAVVRLPHSILPFYLRALRIEERYMEASKAGASLELFVKHYNRMVASSSAPALLNKGQIRFPWLEKERDKLRRTMTGKERGDSFFRNGDYERAAAKYASCLTIDGEGDPDIKLTGDPSEIPNAGGRLHAVLHCNRAACLMAIRRYREASKECTAALRIHTQYMKAMLRRGRCYARLEQHEEAIAEYQRWVHLVEEAKNKANSATANTTTTCFFDRAVDVSDEEFARVKNELEDVKKAMRDAAMNARAEAEFRAERQKWYNENFRRTTSSTTPQKGSNKHDAYSRRQQWYENQDDSTRRWDSFNGASPKKPSGKSYGRSKSYTESARSTFSEKFRRSSSSSKNNYQKDGGNQKNQQSIGSPGSDASICHYAVLQVKKNAKPVEIKKSYHRMALKYHPDKNKDVNASDKFRRIQLAYEMLSDPSARKRYDAEQRLNQFYN